MRNLVLSSSIIIFSLSIVFHIVILMQIIPSSIVWGGRLQNQQELLQFEAISILLNVFFLIIMFQVKGSIQVKIKPKIIRIMLWCMTALFTLNTIGNLLAKSSVETMIFTPVTLLLSICCLYLALQYNKMDPSN